MIRFISLFLLIGCQTGIKWNPDFYVGDYENQAIVNEKGIYVYSDEIEFNNYACLSEEKVLELAEILYRARLPRRNIIFILDKIKLKK